MSRVTATGVKVPPPIGAERDMAARHAWCESVHAALKAAYGDIFLGLVAQDDELEVLFDGAPPAGWEQTLNASLPAA